MSHFTLFIGSKLITMHKSFARELRRIYAGDGYRHKQSHSCGPDSKYKATKVSWRVCIIFGLERIGRGIEISQIIKHRECLIVVGQTELWGKKDTHFRNKLCHLSSDTMLIHSGKPMHTSEKMFRRSLIWAIKIINKTESATQRMLWVVEKLNWLRYQTVPVTFCQEQAHRQEAARMEYL